MAQQGFNLDRDSISCSICLDLLKNPVSLACGHNYCMDCIKGHWDTEGEGGGGVHAYSCPQCRHTFEHRPVLKKNTMLAGLVEQLKKTGAQSAPVEPCYARSEDVDCDSCSGRKLRAFKSCLQCMASYCEQHLQPHYNSPAFKKHKLVEPSKKLQENLCSIHDEVLKIFCRTDRQLICLLCVMDEHKGHHTVPAAKERSEKQKELEASRRNIHRWIQDRERDVKKLQEQFKAINESADRAVQHSEKTFAKMIRSIQKRSSEVKKHLRSKQETEARRVKYFQNKMQEEISALKRRDDGLKQLALKKDHTQFLQSFPSLSAPHSDYKHSSSFDIRPLRHFEDVTKAVSAARDKLQAVLTQAWTNISQTVTEVEVLLPQPQPQPKTRADFLRYSREITLDPNTAHKHVLLSDGNRKVTCMRVEQSYPDHPDRFHSSIHSFIHSSSTACPVRGRGGAGANPSCIGRGQGTPWTVRQSIAGPHIGTDNHSHSHSHLRSIYSIQTTYPQFLHVFGSGRKPEYPGRTHADRGGERPRATRNLYPGPSCCEATVLTTAPPCRNRPDRFTGYNSQVLSAESVSGRCYWEVDWSGFRVFVAVTYKNISRTGNNSAFGWNDKSWSLECDSNSYNFRYNSVHTPVPGPLSSRIGVYVDHREGSLSFYSISDETMTLLHRVQTTFTQPLYAGVWVFNLAAAEFVKLR